MNKEDYVSLEVAQLLKEKGYKVSDNNKRVLKKGEKVIIATISAYQPEYEALPHLYDVLKWLRKEHNIHILIDVDYIHFDPEKYMITMCKIGEYKKAVFYTAFNSYEEAVNASIKEALKYI